jgi:hypothetical protein
MVNASNCCDCGSTNVESCLCHKCIQKTINNGYNIGKEEGRLQGAKEYGVLVDNLLELANRLMDDTVDGNNIIRIMLKSGCKIKQGKDFQWEKELKELK